MVAYSFNPTAYNPNFGGGGDTLGPGKHPVIGSKVELKSAQSNNGNGYIALTVTAIDGPEKGGMKTIRFNVHNQSEQAQRIGNEQLSAACVVMGIVGPWQDTDVLLGKAFVIEVALQKEPNPNKYTDVIGVYTLDGRSAQEAKTNPPQQQGGNAPAGFNAGGGQNTQTTQTGGGGWNANGGNGGGGTQTGTGGAGGGWSMANGADTGNGGGGQTAQQTGGGGGGSGWGQSGGAGGGAQTGGGSGWQQGAGGGGGSGGWGQQG